MNKLLRQMIADSAFFWILLFPLIINTAVSLGIYTYGMHVESPSVMDLALFMGRIGLLFISVGALFYIFFVEAKKLWSQTPALVRINKRFRFRR